MRLAIREVQTETMRRNHLIRIRMANIKSIKIINPGKDEEKHNLSYIVGGSAEW